MSEHIRSSVDAEKLSIKMSPRVLKDLAMLYSDPLDALRELIQNAVDAGATKIKIRLLDKGFTLVFEHNGAPIEGEDFEAFLTAGTDRKEKLSEAGKKQIGFFGIGRFSVFMIAKEAEIHTGSHKLVWRESEMETIYREPLSQYFKGVRWILRLKESVDSDIIEYYLLQRYFGSVPIYINGVKAETGIDFLNDLIVEGGRSPYRAVYTHKIDLALNPTLIIKDIFLVAKENDLPGIAIITDDPRIKLNAQRTIIYDKEYKEWVKETYLSILKAIYEKYRTVNEIDKVIGISNINHCIHVLVYIYNLLDAKKLFKYAVFKDEMSRPISGFEILSQNNVRWLYLYEGQGIKLSDSGIRKLESQGYRVFYIPEKLSIVYDRYVLKEMGFESAKEKVIEVDTKAVAMDADVIKKLSSVFNEIYYVAKEFMENMDTRITTLPFISTSPSSNKRRVRITVSDSVLFDFGDVFDLPKVVDPVRFRIEYVNSPSGFLGSNVVFVRVSDGSIRAFASRHHQKIFVNIANERVARMIEETRMLKNPARITLLWCPLIAHEMVHLVFGIDHDHPMFMDLEEEIIERTIERALKDIDGRSRLET
jgi:hypothetical protein